MSLCVSPDANPNGYSPQYILIVTDVDRSMTERNTCCEILIEISMCGYVLCEIIFSPDMLIHIQMDVWKKYAYEVKRI
jgi:hypothetical protein